MSATLFKLHLWESLFKEDILILNGLKLHSNGYIPASQFLPLPGKDNSDAMMTNIFAKE